MIFIISKKKAVYFPRKVYSFYLLIRLSKTGSSRKPLE